jgi:putative FmdB family regulatory protein
VPIYEYRCESCEHKLEKLQRMSDGVLVDCPECSRPSLKRLVSAPSFRLKGNGWYETDFKQDNRRNLAESSGQDTSDKRSSGTSGKGTTRSSSESNVKMPDTKPAAKSAAKETKHA